MGLYEARTQLAKETLVLLPPHRTVQNFHDLSQTLTAIVRREQTSWDTVYRIGFWVLCQRR